MSVVQMLASPLAHGWGMEVGMTIDAVRALGILSDAEADSLQSQDSTQQISDSLQQIIDSLHALKADSARADSLADCTAGSIGTFAAR